VELSLLINFDLVKAIWGWGRAPEDRNRSEFCLSSPAVQKTLCFLYKPAKDTGKSSKLLCIFSSICRATQLTKGCNKTIGPWLLTLCHKLSLDIPLRSASCLSLFLSHSHKQTLLFLFIYIYLFHNFWCWCFISTYYTADVLLWFDSALVFIHSFRGLLWAWRPEPGPEPNVCWTACSCFRCLKCTPTSWVLACRPTSPQFFLTFCRSVDKDVLILYSSCVLIPHWLILNWLFCIYMVKLFTILSLNQLSKNVLN